MHRHAVIGSSLQKLLRHGRAETLFFLQRQGGARGFAARSKRGTKTGGRDRRCDRAFSWSFAGFRQRGFRVRAGKRQGAAEGCVRGSFGLFPTGRRSRMSSMHRDRPLPARIKVLGRRSAPRAGCAMARPPERPMARRTAPLPNPTPWLRLRQIPSISESLPQARRG